MRDRKTSVYEGGHRVPLFVRWPGGGLAHGADAEELTQVQDLLPTLIELCGLKPIKSPLPFDGTSLAALLKGAATKLPDRKLVVQYRVSGEPWDPAVVMWNKWRLLRANGRGAAMELYHLGRDPGQRKNVIGEHPEVATAMRRHYEAWHAGAKELFDRPRWITVGSEEANPMILYSQDWVGGYCDNPRGLSQATARGYWNVVVDRAGVYELALRRWPRESRKTLTEGWNGPQDKGPSARPIAAANLQVAGGNYTLDAKAGDSEVAFRVRLPTGKTKLETTFVDGQNRALGSAIYVYLKHVGESNSALTPPSARIPGEAAPAPNRGPSGVPRQPARTIRLAEGDLLLADFEGDSYGEWKTEGTAFKSGPTGPKNRVSGHQGERLVDTFLLNESDGPTGKLISPLFRIEHRYLNFLVGGGRTPGKTCVNLLVDGKVVHTAIGTATKDRENRKVMRWISWDLSAFKGKEARVEIVDAASGGWGHIMADQFFLSNRSVDQGAIRR